MDDFEAVNEEYDDGYCERKDVGHEEDTINIDVSHQLKDDEEEVHESTHTYASRQPHPYTSKGIREKIAAELGKKYKSEKNGAILEKHVYNAAIALARAKGVALKATDADFQLVYASVAYETLSSTETIKDVGERLKSGTVEWKNQQYRELIEARSAEEADHTEDVVEGIHECRDCKAAGRVYNKTRNTQIQTRGGDEGMTVFVTCVVCRKMWKQYN